MNEKVIVRSKSTLLRFCTLSLGLCPIIALFLICFFFAYGKNISYVFSEYGPIIAGGAVFFILLAVFFYCMYKNVGVTFTDKRVYGCGTDRKSFDLPLLSVSGVSRRTKDSIVISAASGNIVVSFLGNTDELVQAANALLASRQADRGTAQMDSAELQRLLSGMRVEEDKVRNMRFYYSSAHPTSAQARCYVLPYIGRQGDRTWLCAQYNYTGESWVFLDRVIFAVDDARYTKAAAYSEPVRDNSGHSVWEYINTGELSETDEEMFWAIVKSRETIVRFEGKDYHHDFTVSDNDKAAIREVLTAYEALKEGRDRRPAANEVKPAEKAEEVPAAEKPKAGRDAKNTNKVTFLAAAVAVAAVLVIVGMVFSMHQKSEAYAAAVALVEAGEYDEAVAAFTELGDYKDSAEQILNARYTEALSLFDQGDYDGAISAFKKLGDYKDSAEQIGLVTQAQEDARRQEEYDRAASLLDSGDYENAADAFTELGGYKDSASKADEARNLHYEELYQAALAYYPSDEPVSLPAAWNLFNQCPSDYKDTQLYKDEIDGVLNSLAGFYDLPTGDYDAKIVLRLENDSDGFRIDYQYGGGWSNSFNYTQTAISWLVENGQAVYGVAKDDLWSYTVTPSGNTMVVESTYDDLCGTYTKR